MAEEMTDLEITTLLTRLARPHASGGSVIERAAILAAGADSPAVISWILDHAGTPETVAPVGRSHGLHGARITGGNEPAQRPPARFVLPAGTFN